MVVDLYHGDVVTSFADAATSGIRGIIHKATQGTRVADSAYGARRGNAADVGLLWGAYHFATARTSERSRALSWRRAARSCHACRARLRAA